MTPAFPIVTSPSYSQRRPRSCRSAHRLSHTICRDVGMPRCKARTHSIEMEHDAYAAIIVEALSTIGERIWLDHLEYWSSLEQRYDANILSIARNRSAAWQRIGVAAEDEPSPVVSIECGEEYMRWSRTCGGRSGRFRPPRKTFPPFIGMKARPRGGAACYTRPRVRPLRRSGIPLTHLA